MKKHFMFLLLMFFCFFNAAAQPNQDFNMNDICVLSGYDFGTKALATSVDMSMEFYMFRFDLECGLLTKTNILTPETCVTLSPMFGCVWSVWGKCRFYIQIGYESLVSFFSTFGLEESKQTTMKFRTRTGMHFYLGERVFLNVNATYSTSFFKETDFWPEKSMLLATLGLGYAF